MLRNRLRSTLLALLLAIAACAKSPTLADVASTVPPLPPGEARIYFYRAEGPYQTQTWTTVYLNGRAAGDAAPQTVFYRDVPPGQYEITLRSIGLYPFQFKSVALDAGQTLYVRIESIRSVNKGLGAKRAPAAFVVQPVDPATGRREIENLAYISG